MDDFSIENVTLVDEVEFNSLSDTEAYRYQGDDFENHLRHWQHGYTTSKTGRHRRKLAARVKGGEFQASRRKRRLYFSCLGTQINIEGLHSSLSVIDTWDIKRLPDVLRLFRHGICETEREIYNTDKAFPFKLQRHTSTGAIDERTQEPVRIQKQKSQIYNHMMGLRPDIPMGIQDTLAVLMQQSSVGAQEVYIFEFGAAVFWGFPKGEEALLLNFIKTFVTKGMLLESEFEQGEDDIAFITSPEATSITIANDVILMPEDVIEKQRLAVSYAYAQSSILAVYESRVDQQANEYKYIPETLAKCGSIRLTHLEIGRMIGQIFVVRHDVNLHTVVLDTPDFFWKQEEYEKEYRMTTSYLEIQGRVESVNRKLDMLQELLVVLKHQQERDHAETLEWIVILLCVLQIVFEYPIYFPPFGKHH